MTLLLFLIKPEIVYSPRGLEAVAVEKNFYTVDGLEDPYCWEKAYAKSIEPMMSMLLPKIISRVHVLVQTGHCHHKQRRKIPVGPYNGDATASWQAKPRI